MIRRTIQEKVATQHYKIPSAFFWKALNKLVLKPFLAKPYNINLTVKDDINECKTGCFLVYNHQSRMDYMSSVQLCYPRRLNYVVGYNEFFRSKFKLIFKLMQMIPKKNFTKDLPAIRGMSEIIRRNGVVCIAPEGMSSINGHNQPVALGTGKLFKNFKVPVYMMKTKGGFLTSTKVYNEERPGRIDSELSLLFTKEQVEQMSAEEIETKLNEALWQDDYEWNKVEHVRYKMKGNSTEHLYDLLYHCPKCGHEFEMEADGMTMKCKHCGNGFMMDEYYDMHPFDGSIIWDTPSKWVDEERKLVYHEIKDNPNYEFKVKVSLGCLPKYKYLPSPLTSIPCGEGELIINHQGIDYIGTDQGKKVHYHLDYNVTPTTGMVTNVSYLSLYFNEEFYDIFPEIPCVGKILLLIEEMHRFHDGKWKNLPWLDTYK